MHDRYRGAVIHLICDHRLEIWNQSMALPGYIVYDIRRRGTSKCWRGIILDGHCLATAAGTAIPISHGECQGKGGSVCSSCCDRYILGGRASTDAAIAGNAPAPAISGSGGAGINMPRRGRTKWAVRSRYGTGGIGIHRDRRAALRKSGAARTAVGIRDRHQGIICRTRYRIGKHAERRTTDYAGRGPVGSTIVVNHREGSRAR